MAFDAFMFFEGGSVPVAGETTDKTYAAKKAFEIGSFRFGIKNVSTVGSKSGGAGSGKAEFTSFRITKRTDSASPALYQACALGAHYPTATIVLRKAGGTQPVEYLRYIFNMVFVNELGWSGSSGDDQPVEEVDFTYGSCEMYYQAQTAKGDPAGKVSASWNVVLNSKDPKIP